MTVSLTGYQQEIQMRGNWCWAAMVTSLVHFHFQRDPAPPPPPADVILPLRQCQVVTAVLGTGVLGETDCCQAPGMTDWPPHLDPPPGAIPVDGWENLAPCNSKAPDDPAVQDYLLAKFGIRYGYIDGPLLEHEIARQLSDGWPVFIARTDGDGGVHILAITGIDGNRLSIEDSQGDVKSATFNNLKTEPVQDPGLLTGEINGAARLYRWARTYFHI